MANVDEFAAALGDMPIISDPTTVRRKSRDMTAVYSPVMRREMKDKFADLIVRPRSKVDVLRVAAAAAQYKIPIIARGAGTANFGQGIPLAGGAIVDMTALDQILWIKDGKVRSQSGTKLMAIDEATRPKGWELRMHSSTKSTATIGGYVGGGHAGIGSCAYGILRDRGNILGLEVVSIEEEPKVVELRGDSVNLVHHAYGTNGLITEIEMPLAPAWPWAEAIVLFDDFLASVRFAHALATSDGIIKKLISVIGDPIPRLMRPLEPFIKPGAHMVLCMIAAPFEESFRALAQVQNGVISCWAMEGKGPYQVPIYEFAWGHTRFHVNKEDPALISAVGLYASLDPVADIAKSHARFAPYGMHFEVKRFDGRLSFQGSPLFPYTDDAALADVMRGMAEDGAMVANNHTFLVKEGGMKSVAESDAEFKKRMDPFGLMNPGKLSFDRSTKAESAGASLPSAGWRYQEAGAT